MRLSAQFLILSSVGWLCAPLSAAPLDALAKKLASGATSLQNKKVAVLTFPYHDEKVSSGSTLVSERLTTCLVERKEVRVLERSLIGQVLKEKKLSESGVVDPRSFKAIGKILDAEAIVTGTLIDLPNNMTEINARLIRTDTGEVLSAGRAIIERTWTDSPCEVIQRAPPPVHSQATRAPTPVQTAAVDEGPAVKKISGKSLKLSNDNFPADHRRYLPNERYPSPRPPIHNMPYNRSSASQVFDGDEDSQYSDTADSSPRQPHSSGYNGTDSKALPPSKLHSTTRPLGSIQY